MRFGVLGPLDVRTADGAAVRVPERKVRALLAALLAHRGRAVSAERLAADLWGGAGPGNPTRALHAKVSQLRRALAGAEPGGRGLVESRVPGWLLRAAATDADRFAELVERARGAADPAARSALLGDALGLWRGPAFAGFAELALVRAEVTRLEELRLVALEDLAEARLELGGHAELVPELAEAVRRHPLRERLRAAHLRALHRSGRRAEALAGYEELRRRLAEELGADPGPELVALHRAVLAQDPGPARPADNLPSPLTPLVGRDAEVARVRGLLGAHRLVTLTGPGGVGKTRLAVASARRLLDAFPDGVWLVELAAPGSPPELPELVAAVLGVRDDGAPGLGDVVARLVGAVRDKRLLLVLDNCEHVVARVVALLAALLPAAPGLHVLATSREPLAMAGEVRRPVPPLDPDAAVELFLARVAAAAPDAVVDLPAARAVCARLDGIPLALELAATRVPVLGLAALPAALDDRFRVLAGGYRDAPPRQRTLRAVLDWSWELLDDRAREVLRRLAVHAEGCDLAAAERVCGGDDVLGVLAGLVDRSLVLVAAPGGRYRLAESVAAYCLERLEEAGELDEVRTRHARHYADLAEEAAPHLRGPGQREWLDRLDAESANLRTALDHVVRRGLGAVATRLVDALAWYWVLRGRLGEARRRLEAVHTVARTPATVAWHTGVTVLMGDGADRDERVAEVLASCDGPHTCWLLGHALYAVGDVPAGEPLVDRALAGFTATGDRWGTAAALGDRAFQWLLRGDLDASARDGERSAALFGELGDTWGQLRVVGILASIDEARGDYAAAAGRLRAALHQAERLRLWSHAADLTGELGRVALLTGDHERARELHERSRDLARRHGYPIGEAHAEMGLALGARRTGDLDGAERHLLAVLDRHRHAGLVGANALPLAELGFVAELRGDRQRALALHQEGYRAALTSGDPRATALALEGLACARAADEPELAATLLGTADAARRSRGAPLPPAERGDVDRATTALVEVLGGDFARHFARGAALTPRQAFRLRPRARR
ncbi:ATP-binding protein [Saccharothrix syringae]|nr:BTAD domain-containing putative transcriptional regulator [Saccharothrix syringae]